MTYRMLNGEDLPISTLLKEDMEFLLELMHRAMEDEDYFALKRSICGPNAYPLKGNLRVTREIHNSLLFRIAEDIIDRVGIRMGVFAPNSDDDCGPIDEIMSVTEAATKLNITRSAVIKAARLGRIKGKKIGHTWALLRRSAVNYQVSLCRVTAGRAAHQS